MYYVYVLKSSRYNRHYIGLTASLQKRVERHDSGGVRSTRFYRPWELVHSERFPDRKLARNREAFLKKNATARSELFDKIDRK
jgi:putative endonuclease